MSESKIKVATDVSSLSCSNSISTTESLLKRQDMSVNEQQRCSMSSHSGTAGLEIATDFLLTTRHRDFFCHTAAHQAVPTGRRQRPFASLNPFHHHALVLLFCFSHPSNLFALIFDCELSTAADASYSGLALCPVQSLNLRDIKSICKCFITIQFYEKLCAFRIKNMSS